MAEYVLMPQKGLTEESAILSAWHVKAGDTVKKGDYLFDIETGKAVFSIESETDGTVLALFAQEGEEVPIRQPVVVIGQPGEAFDRPAAGQTAGPEPAAPAPAPVEPASPSPVAAAPMAPAVPVIPTDPAAPAIPTAPMAPAAAVRAAEPGARVFSSPKARAVAAEHGIDLAQVAPTGPNDRVIRDDVLRALTTGTAGIAAAAETAASVSGAAASQYPGAATETAAGTAAAFIPAYGAEPAGEPFTVVRNSTIRKTIARNMHQSLQQMAQLTLFASFDATSLLDVRERLKARDAAAARNAASTNAAGAGAGITINDMLIFAVSRTILDFPTLNAHFSDENTTLFRDAHIGMAVDTKNGLLVPTVFHAQRLSLRQIAATTRSLAAACQEGKATPQMLSGATFTTTNLGALRIEAFTPVIAPPQTAILGIGCIDYKVRKTAAGFEHYPAIGLSLTFDHRAVDGAPAARFLKALCERLEDYLGLLVE